MSMTTPALFLSETWIGSGQALTFDYNEAGLVTEESSPDQTLSIDYWPTGSDQRLEHSLDGPDWWVDYVYDGNGNVIEVSDSAGGLDQYVYDGLDRMIVNHPEWAGVFDKRVEFESIRGPGQDDPAFRRSGRQRRWADDTVRVPLSELSGRDHPDRPPAPG